MCVSTSIGHPVDPHPGYDGRGPTRVELPLALVPGGEGGAHGGDGGGVGRPRAHLHGYGVVQW